MTQVNYLQVGEEVHCLRCHGQVERDVLIAHVDAGCINKDAEPKIDRQNCEYCRNLPPDFGKGMI